MHYNYKNKLLILKALKNKSPNEIAKTIKEKVIMKPWDWGKTEEWALVKSLETKLGISETHMKRLEKGK